MMMSVLVMPLLRPLRLLLAIIDTQRGQELPSLDGVVHHRAVGVLLGAADGEERILADLGCGVAGVAHG